MPRYCSRCILPDTRPGVFLDEEGVCRGCRNAAQKSQLDWSGRAAAFDDLISGVKARGAAHDCLIPVSGGKDSYWQVVTCLERGLKPLCVTYVYPGRTELGRRNLEGLIALGVDHLELRLSPRVERTFVEKAWRKTGISGLVSHMAIYNWPVRIALQQGIPLVVFGENSAFEYGSEDDSLVGSKVDSKWLRTFGVTAGTTAADWVDDELSARDLACLYPPDAEVMATRETDVVFLGHFFPWDPENSLAVASANGFRARTEGARVGHYNFVNIDDDMIGVHHHPKWHKFGITRSWDTLSMEIRAGRLTRDEAISKLRASGDETPHDDIHLFCEYLGIDAAEYHRVLEGFRNQGLWTRQDDRYVIEGFLVDDFPWPADELAPTT